MKLLHDLRESPHEPDIILLGTWPSTGKDPRLGGEASRPPLVILYDAYLVRIYLAFHGPLTKTRPSYLEGVLVHHLLYGPYLKHPESLKG